jgi:hypothetical protein
MRGPKNPNRKFRLSACAWRWGLCWLAAENPRRNIGSTYDQACGSDVAAFALGQQPEMEGEDGMVFHDLEEVRGV